MPSSPLSFLLILLFVTLFSSTSFPPSTTAQVATLPFSYLGSNGPNRWGSLSPNFTDCSSGTVQSPINVERCKVLANRKLRPLQTNYHPTNATLLNSGCNIQLKFGENAGGLMLEGKNYQLKQMHWHSPSEHLLDGIRYDAELHLVHVADDGNVSVVGILYQHGNSDTVISEIEKKLVELGNMGRGGHEEDETPIPLGNINISEITSDTHNSYYRYVGSLTTPPCKQNVIWHILSSVRTISGLQVDELKAPLSLSYKNNSRPIQPLNGRIVEFYSRGHHHQHHHPHL